MDREVKLVDKATASALVRRYHYLHREPPISYAIGLWDEGVIKGVATFGTPASRQLQVSVCSKQPELVVELNRLLVADSMERNTETWFLSRALDLLPPLIVISYADTAQGHMGYVYRAANFYYAGWTDMERNSPRKDYIAVGHSRNAFRGDGLGAASMRRDRSTKVKYWTTVGNRKEKKLLLKLCEWPKLSWKEYPPPTDGHKKLAAVTSNILDEL